MEVGDDEWNSPVYGSPTVLHPGDPSQLDASVPRLIADSFVEARTCFRANAPTATAIMCRRTIEGLCQQQGAMRGTLEAKLQYLRDAGIIERRLFEWADALRLAGNDAAHDVEETTTNEDARDLLEFTRAILEYVYTFNDAFQRFTERRNARRAAVTPEAEAAGDAAAAEE